MRVLFVNENIGGHATVHHHLLRALEEYGDVTVQLLEVPPPSPIRRLLGAAVPGLGRLDLDLQPLRAQLGTSAWVARHLRRAAAGVDVVHVYTHNAGLLSASTLARMPSVVSLDTTNANNAYRLPYRHPTRFTPLTVAVTKVFERRVYAGATAVVANSEWAARSLRQDYGLDDERLHVLPFGIVPPDVDPPAAPGTRAERPKIVFVGRQLERKGGLRLLELHQAHLSDRADLLLITQETPPPAAGVEVIDDLRPGDPRLWSLLRDCAIFAFPSAIDQAPNAVLEAMAAGLPVVALATAAVPEMVRDGHTGFVVPPDDDAALLGALRQLVDDAEARATMGANGRAWMLERYDAAKSCAALLHILAEATSQGPRRPRPTPPDRSHLAPGLGRARRAASAAWQLARHRRASGGAVVLAYHDVEETAGAEWSVTPSQLAAHVALLARLGMHIVALDEILERHAAGSPVDGLAAITFDDALIGVHRHALPLLRAEAIPATVFVVSDAGPEPPPWWPGARRCLGRDELGDLVVAGWTIGSHTCSHASLPAVDAEAKRVELGTSRRELASSLGVGVDLLAYPSGHHDAATRAAVRASGYRAAFTFLNGRIVGGEDPMRLPRLTMGRHATTPWLALQLGRSATSWPDHQLETVTGNEGA